MMLLLHALALISAQPETAAPIKITNDNGVASSIDGAPNADSSKIDEAANLIKNGKAADAIPILDGVIARMNARYTGVPQVIYSSRSMTESIIYVGLAGAQNKAAVVLDDTWATAHFLKGFVLIDLGRNDEAKTQFDKAIALAPMNAQFLAERAEWYKNRKDWVSAYADFESASTGAEFSPEDAKTFEKGRALRGMAFVRIEQGQLNEAEKLLKQALKLDRNDAKARQELDYIKSLSKS